MGNAFMGRVTEAIKGWWLYGAFVGLVVWLLGKQISNLPSWNITFSTIQVPVGDVALPDVGTRFLTWLKFGDAPWVAIITSAMILVIVGRIVYGFLPLGGGKTPMHKVALTLMYGALVGTLIVSGIGGLPWGGALLAFFIYWVIIALISFAAWKWAKMPIPQ